MILLMLPAALSVAGQKESFSSARPAFVPGEVIVAFKPTHSLSTLSTTSKNLMAASHVLGATREGVQFARVKLRKGATMDNALALYGADPAVLAVSPNYLEYPTLNDPSYPEVWGLHNTGQTISSPSYTINNPGNAGSDVHAPEAWGVMTGSSSIVVAVIDTGVDYTHPDLAGAMWDASLSTRSRQARMDGTSRTSTVTRTRSTQSMEPMLPGLLLLSGNNSIGIPGVAYGVKIMALKVFPDKGGGAADGDIISAINYAVANNADIINMSLGRNGAEDTALTLAVQNAVSAGVLIAVAAGNDGKNNDTIPFWPANYANLASTSSGVISVLASDQKDQPASFSNYGVANVTIGAPGVNVLSTVTGRE